MSTNVDERAVVRAVLESADEGEVVLAVPGSDYRLRLKPAGVIDTPAGKRIRGTIEGRALRVHHAQGGGQFIEPVAGEPRIVAGTVIAVEADSGRFLIQTAVPMWLRTLDGQDFDVIQEGSLVNCYVESGMTLTPVAG